MFQNIMSYIVPIHCPTSIRHAVKLQFLEPGEDSLIVAYASTQIPQDRLLTGVQKSKSTRDILFGT